MSGSGKAYKVKAVRRTFGEAWEICQVDGAWPAMIKTKGDLQDLKDITQQSSKCILALGMR